MDHRNNFNLLRLFAASQVMFMHCSAHLHLPAPGWLFGALSQFPGVAVFFVISGFLVTESCLRSTPGAFFRKRCLRIYPGLIVNIIVLEIVVAASGGLQVESWPKYFAIYLQLYFLTASDYLAGLFTTVHHIPSFFNDYPSGVMWTLTVELTFYLVLPPMLAVARWSRPVGALLILAEAAASYALVIDADDAFYARSMMVGTSVPTCFWVFAIGVLAKLYWNEIARAFEGRIFYWLASYAALGFWFDGGWLDYRYHVSPTSMFRILIMAGVVLSIAFSFRGVTRALGIDRNDFSYGLYLYHMLVVQTLVAMGASKEAWLWLAVFGYTLVLAAASWFMIEQPALRFKTRDAVPASGQSQPPRRPSIDSAAPSAAQP